MSRAPAIDPPDARRDVHTDTETTTVTLRGFLGHGLRRLLQRCMNANSAIAAFSLLLVVLLATAVGMQIRHEHNDVVAHVIQSNANLSVAYEQQTIRMLKSIDATAVFLAREYARLGTQLNLRPYVEDGTIEAALVTAVIVVDEYGDVVAISNGNAPQYIADREYFKVHLERDSGKLHVSRPVIGRATGRPTILMSRRMNKPDGTFAGVVGIGVDPHSFADFYQQLDLGRNGLATLVGVDGVVRVRRSGDRLTFGQDMSDATLLQEQRKAASGSFIAHGRIEEVRRFTSYRTVEGYPLIIAVGVAEDEVLAGHYQRRAKYFWTAALTALVIIAFTALLIGALARRNRAMAMLVRSDRRIQATFNHAGIGIVHASLDGRVLQANQQFANTMGRPVTDFLGRSFFDFTPVYGGRDTKDRCEAVVRALAHTSSVQLEQICCGKNGAQIAALITFSIVHDEAGKPDYLLAAIHDVTRQKRLESELRERNKKLTEVTVELNNVLESSTLYSIISMDLGRTIRSWNEGARRNYGFSAEEMVNQTNSSVLHTAEDNANGRVAEIFSSAYKSGPAEGVFEQVRKDRSQFTASVSVTLRRDPTGTPIGYLLISRDITEQELLKQELTLKNSKLAEQNRRVEEANRLKSQFLANMSHELRTPLNAIIGFSEVMHDGVVGEVSSEHKEFLGDILTSAKHLLHLINDVLDLAKIEAGKMAFDAEPVHLLEISNEVRDVLHTISSRKHIDVAIDVDPLLDDVVGDVSKLKQVLYNYLSNALKFTPQGGRVTIRAMQANTDQYRLEVEDTGIGIEAEDLDRLFTEFRQLDTSTAKQYQGTGLGLALTKRIVEAQGGTVGVVSMPGNGSTFHAVLPRIMHTSEVTAPLTPVYEDTRGSAGSILLIDDDPAYRGWAARFLHENGFRVTVACDGFEAIEAGNAMRFDTILLDILLPGLDGWETLRAIRRHGLNRETPVIVVSITRPAEAFDADRTQDFLVKPVDGAALLKALEAVRTMSDQQPSETFGGGACASLEANWKIDA